MKSQERCQCQLKANSALFARTVVAEEKSPVVFEDSECYSGEGTSISFLNALGCFLAAPESVLLLRSTVLTRPAIKLALGGADCRITSGCASTRSKERLRPGKAKMPVTSSVCRGPGRQLPPVRTPRKFFAWLRIAVFEVCPIFCAFFASRQSSDAMLSIRLRCRSGARRPRCCS